MTQVLLDRLAVFYDESWASRIMAGSANWPQQHQPVRAYDFGVAISDLKTIVPHMTAGWPSRNKASSWLQLYTTQGIARWGEGPSFFVSGDGTVARLIDMPRVTWHASFVNQWSLGIETGNLGKVARPPGNGWIQLNQDSATQANDDIPGARAWLRDHRDDPREVLCSWWTTANFAGPRRGPIQDTWMLFTEWQYRSLSLLCRYLAEEHRVPRNVPLLPHVLRTDVINVSDEFRRIVLADPALEEIAASLTSSYNIVASDFQPANAATLQGRYTAAAAIQVADATYRRHNKVWRAMFDTWRGFHGHGYPGAISARISDHDCPGPLFDWHRFARELWDYWWLPFDVDAAGSTSTPRRSYQNPDGTTPVHEFYFDESEITRLARVRHGVHGPAGSPETFTLDAGSPVYAMANGELVAARMSPADPNHVSTSFVLVRHEVFHLPHPLSQQIATPMFPSFPFVLMPDTIDYSREPHYVYTLYMHLGRQGSVDLENVSAGNPDWLNRVLIRKKECDLGVSFYSHATHHGIPDQAWTSPLPGSAVRSTLRESWEIDRVALDAFLSALRNGDVAIGLPRSPIYHPIRILLGDFLGHADICEVRAGVATHGVRVEAFSPQLLPGFSPEIIHSSWTPSAGLPNPPALFYQSEWARTPTAAEAATLTANGFDPNTPSWWNAVSLTTAWLDDALPPRAQLSPIGFVWHYRALDVARWLNGVTWRHERQKYASATAAQMVRPPSRRV
ncbi:MAG: N-acetylmuramoyl-L-alanine amidase [Kofleriaceae bacterium]